MRSVNITYKKTRRESTGQLLATRYSTTKRTVDDYYQRLLEKEQNRQRLLSHKRQALQRNKLRTASQRRLKDPLHIIDTLNIHTLPIRESVGPVVDEKRQQNRSQLKLLISRKLSVGQLTLHGLNPSHIPQVEQQQQKQAKWPSHKLKRLFKPKSLEHKSTILALSANFIIDEHYCWQGQQIQQNSVKQWKMLQNYSNIAWICQKQETVRKMVRFSKDNGLRLDAVYCVVPRKNRKLLTVNYSNVEEDFGIKGGNQFSSPLTKQQKKLVVVQGLLIDNYDHLTYNSFYNAVPLIKNNHSTIHYTRVDPCDSNRFASVVKILSQSHQPRPYYIMRILREFHEHQDNFKQLECKGCSMGDFKQQEEKDALDELQKMKGRLVKFFERSMSMKMSDRLQERTNSIQFMIGDAIRRNYKIYQNILEFQSECSHNNKHKEYHSTRSSSPISPRRLMAPQKYTNLVYLWRL